MIIEKYCMGKITTVPTICAFVVMGFFYVATGEVLMSSRSDCDSVQNAESSFTRGFKTKNEAISYYTCTLSGQTRGRQIVQGGGRSSVTTTTETRWYADEITPNNYLGSTYEWTQYSRNTCGTVVPYPESDFVLYEKFSYKDPARSLKKVFKGKVVVVSIGIISTASLGDAARTRAMKNLVEAGGNYKDKAGAQIRQPPLNRIIRKRFGFASMKTIYMQQGVMFLLFDCDESKDDEKVKIILP